MGELSRSRNGVSLAVADAPREAGAARPRYDRLNPAEAICGLLRVFSGDITARDAATDVDYARQMLEACLRCGEGVPSDPAGGSPECRRTGCDGFEWDDGTGGRLSVRAAIEGLLAALDGSADRIESIDYAERVLRQCELERALAG